MSRVYASSAVDSDTDIYHLHFKAFNGLRNIKISSRDSILHTDTKKRGSPYLSVLLCFGEYKKARIALPRVSLFAP